MSGFWINGVVNIFVTSQKKHAYIKQKLLDLKTPEFQDVFSSFIETNSVDIISIDSYIILLVKLVFCPVTSQNGSGRCISITRHCLEISYRGEFLFLISGPIFREDVIFCVNPPFKI